MFRRLFQRRIKFSVVSTFRFYTIAQLRPKTIGRASRAIILFNVHIKFNDVDPAQLVIEKFVDEAK